MYGDKKMQGTEEEKTTIEQTEQEETNAPIDSFKYKLKQTNKRQKKTVKDYSLEETEEKCYNAYSKGTLKNIFVAFPEVENLSTSEMTAFLLEKLNIEVVSSKQESVNSMFKSIGIDTSTKYGKQKAKNLLKAFKEQQEQK